MNLKDELKKGQAFIGLDDNKYYFLGYDYDDQIFFTNIDLWSDKEQSYMTKSNIFIKEVLDEKSKVIEDSTWYYQSMKELDNSTMEEKIKRCFDIIKNSNSKDFELRPTEIGPLVRGQAYSKEFNQYYEVIGFIVENNIYVDKDLKANQNFLDLSGQLNETENKISFSRQFYNDSVTRYNTKLELFPSNIIANMFNFKSRELFAAESDEARKNVKVDFNN